MNSLSVSVLIFGLVQSGVANPAPAPERESTAIPFDQIGAVAQKQYSGGGLSVTSTKDGALLRCVFQRLDGEAAPDGLWLKSTVPDQSVDRFRVKAVAVGQQCLPDRGDVSLEGGIVRFSRPGLVEEYSVSMDGVRQDFLVLEVPDSSGRELAPSEAGGGKSEPTHVGCYKSDGELRVNLAVSGARVEQTEQGAQLILEKSGRKIAYSRLKVSDAEGKELPARIEVAFNNAHHTSHSELAMAVVVDDSEASYPIRIDPTFSDANWIGIGSGGANNIVHAAVVDEYGNLYVGGEFTAVGGVSASRIARWNGTLWSALGSGIGGTVYALALSGTNVIAGGGFGTAGGNWAFRIAKWNGSAWSPLGSGMNNSVLALAVSGTNVYAGGLFSTAGGSSANYIARWDGSSWSALGLGMNNYVNALAVLGNDVYAGGPFTVATNSGGAAVTVNRIAKWDGSAWTGLGLGMSCCNVLGLTVAGSDLYAAGIFLKATNSSGAVVTVNNIAKWNGSSWSGLGLGMNNTVRAVSVVGGTVYAGGIFTMATNSGGAAVAVNRIAKWENGSWSALGFGMNSNVYALAASGSDLYAGGLFTTAGGKTATNVARAVLQPSPPQIIQQPSSLAVATGSNITFQVTATGTSPLAFRWRKLQTNLFDAGRITGVTTTNLSLSDAQMNDAGDYSVVISNSFGSVTSAVAILTIIGAPVIMSHPAGLVRPLGETASFSAVVTGASPLWLQWRKNGTNLNNSATVSGANSTNLVLANIQLSDAGNYNLVVSNAVGSVVSQIAALWVDTNNAAGWPRGPRGTAYRVVVTNSLAYIGLAGWRVRIVDVADPMNPVSLGGCNGVVEKMAVVGQFAYFAGSIYGFGIYDISDPLNPQQASAPWSFSSGGYFNGVAIAGNYAYVVDGSGLRVLNVGNPYSPTVVGEESFSGFSCDVAVSGNHAFVANGTHGMVVLDISNPASPLVVQQINGFFAFQIVISGHQAYLAGQESGLRIINISNPTNCFQTGSYFGGNYVNWVEVRDNVAFLGDSQGLKTLNVSDPTNPIQIGYHGIPSPAEAIAVSGNNAYVAAGNSGLRIFNIANPAVPTPVSQFDTDAFADAYSVSAKGEQILLADAYAGLRVIDKASLTEVNTLNFLTPAIAVSVNGTNAFAGYDTKGFRVFDISDFANPTVKGGRDMSGEVLGITAVSNRIYVAAGSIGLWIYDLTSPLSPELGGLNTSGTAYNVAVGDGVAYVADGTGGLKLISVTNPASPQLLATFNSPQVLDVKFSDGHAFVADSILGLRVINVNNPANAIQVGAFPNINARCVDVLGSFVYVGTGSNLLFVLSVTNLANPSLITSFSTHGPVNDVSVSGNRAYVATGSWGLEVFELGSFAPSPRIIQQPLNSSTLVGDTATFKVTATGDGSLAFQWRKNGVNLVNGGNLSGGTSTNLMMINVQLSDAGHYSVVVRNAYGSVISSVAILNVSVPGEMVTLGDYFPLPLNADWLYDGTDWDGAAAKTRYQVKAVNTNITLYTGRSPAVAYTTNGIQMAAAFLDRTTLVAFDTWEEYLAIGGRFGQFGYDDLPSDSLRVDGGVIFPAQMAVGGSATNMADAYLFGTFAGVMTNVLQVLERTSLTVPAGYFPDVLHVRWSFQFPGGAQVHDEWWARSVGKIKRQGISDGGAAHNIELISYSVPIPPTIIGNDGSMGFVLNTFGFNVIGPLGQTAAVEVSTNLVNWLSVQTNTFGPGPIYFSDPSSQNLPRRFYRLRAL